MFSGFGFIEGTSTEYEWILNCLKEKCEEFRELIKSNQIRSIDANDISGGKGFISKVYKVDITFDHFDTKPFEFIVKIPGLESLNQVLEEEHFPKHHEPNKEQENNGMQLLANIHNNEVKFYQLYSTIPNLKLLKVYGSRQWVINKQEGALIMAYSGQESFSIPLHESMNFEQMSHLIDQIFCLQTYFLLLPDQTWKETFVFPFSPDHLDGMTKLIQHNWNIVKNFVNEEVYVDISDHIDNLISNFKNICTYNTNILINKPHNTKVFVHGDLYMNNILYGKFGNDQQEENDLRIVDWQLVHAGNIGSDIARSLLTGTSPQLRHKMEESILPKFYHNIVLKATAHQVKFEMSWEMFKENYNCHFVEQSLHFLMVVAFTMHQINTSKDSQQLLEIKKKAVGMKLCTGLRDAIAICKKFNQTWISDQH
uniref:CHK domain-containing protein n=1 Tax=Rhabditophanes sp. KR3021 TaxID=114890 RepID=A0AC35TQW0_9BILA